MTSEKYFGRAIEAACAAAPDGIASPSDAMRELLSLLKAATDAERHDVYFQSVEQALEQYCSDQRDELLEEVSWGLADGLRFRLTRPDGNDAA